MNLLGFWPIPIFILLAILLAYLNLNLPTILWVSSAIPLYLMSYVDAEASALQSTFLGIIWLFSSATLMLMGSGC